MPRKKAKSPNQNDFNPLVIGKDESGKEISLPDLSLLNNGLIVIGTKNSGKSEMIPSIFLQQIIAPYEDEAGQMFYPMTNAGFTYIVSKPDQAYYLYAIAKKQHRPDVRLLKPSTNYKVKNTLLGMTDYNYDTVDDIINYRRAIRDKEVVIIDMENDRYEDASVQAVGVLLMQLQVTMHNTAETIKRRHFLVIDDAYQYLPYLETILRYGSAYNVATILFFESRAQYKEFEGLIETNLQNILLMPAISFDDAKYFSERFFIDSPKEFLGRGKDNVFYAFFSDDMKLDTGSCVLTHEIIDDHEDELLRASARKYKKALDKAGSDDEYVNDILKAFAKYTLNVNRRYNPGNAMTSAANAVARDIEAKKQNPLGDTNNTDQNTAAPIIPEEPENETVEILPNIQQHEISVEEAMRPGKMLPDINESERTAGLKQLYHIMENSPKRIQERLKESGISVPEKKEDSKPEAIFDPTAETIDLDDDLAPAFGGIKESGLNVTPYDPEIPADNSETTAQEAHVHPKKKKKKKKRKPVTSRPEVSDSGVVLDTADDAVKDMPWNADASVLDPTEKTIETEEFQGNTAAKETDISLLADEAIEEVSSLMTDPVVSEPEMIVPLENHEIEKNDPWNSEDPDDDKLDDEEFNDDETLDLSWDTNPMNIGPIFDFAVEPLRDDLAGMSNRPKSSGIQYGKTVKSDFDSFVPPSASNNKTTQKFFRYKSRSDIKFAEKNFSEKVRRK